jgi:translation initiation factor 3 subunit J
MISCTPSFIARSSGGLFFTSLTQSCRWRVRRRQYTGNLTRTSSITQEVWRRRIWRGCGSPLPNASPNASDTNAHVQVLEDWEAADDSETEREKAKKAEEEKAKAAAIAKANAKSKAQRVAEHQAERARRLAQDEDDSSDEDETEEERRARLRQTEKDSDLRHAEDLFGDLQVTNNRRAVKPVTLADPNDAGNAIDLSSLPIFNPSTKDQFTKLRETLTPLLAANSKKAHYTLFMQEFTKAICKELPSDQIKKIASGITTLSNEKMKEEKQTEKGGKKTKAQKTKTVLQADRGIGGKSYADTHAYNADDGMDE